MTEASIFGDLDINNIPDDPFYIAPKTYWGVCTDAVVKENKDGVIQLNLKWTIDEPADRYHGKTRTEYFGLFPGKSEQDLTPEEFQATTWLKRRLRRAFDLSETEIKAVKPSQLIGKGAFLTLKENKGKGESTGRTFINVFDAVSKRLFDEERGSDSTAQDLGL